MAEQGFDAQKARQRFALGSLMFDVACCSNALDIVFIVYTTYLLH
jgi:hypothetical protein